MKLHKLLLAAIAAFSITAQAAKPQLDVELSVNTDDKGDVFATLKFTNNGKGPKKLLKWYAQYGEGHLFDVQRDGQYVRYIGPIHKRGIPGKKDFHKLAPGASLTQTFEMSSLYDMSEMGNYQITYDVGSMHLHGINGSDIAELKSSSSFVYLKGNSKKPGNGGGGSEPPADGQVSYANCSNSQQSSISTALNAAQNMASDSVSYLYSHNENTMGPRYTTWFGTPTASTVATARDHFDKISDAADRKPIEFNCACTSSSFAYVYPTQPYKIWLCNAFWSANVTGTDSRGGTIIHELSHFDVVAGTDDLAYGHSAAKRLARKANRALNNADNHEYFAENTPAQN